MPKTGLDTVASCKVDSSIMALELARYLCSGIQAIAGQFCRGCCIFSIARKIRALPNPGYPVSMFAYALRICVTSTFTFESCRAALFSNCSTVESWSWACFIRWNHATSLWNIFGRFSDRMSFCFHSTHDDVPVIFKALPDCEWTDIYLLYLFRAI